MIDFYYSAKQEKAIRQLNFMKVDPADRMPIWYFKGRRYTEMVEHGEGPSGKWDDYEFLGTGGNKDIVYGGRDKPEDWLGHFTWEINNKQS